MRYTTTAFVSSIYYYADAATVCSAPGAPTTSSIVRICISMEHLQAQVHTTGNGIRAINSNAATVSPSTTTTYTVTATIPGTGCTATQTASVTVIPLPTQPSATNSTQCG
jgi:hypothetical protein